MKRPPLFNESFVLVRPLEDQGKPVPNKDTLREMRLLLLEEGHCFREQALSFCDMGSVRPREILDGSSLTTLVQMVGAGIGVTLIRKSPCRSRHARPPSPSPASRSRSLPDHRDDLAQDEPIARQLTEVADWCEKAADGLRTAAA